MQYQKVTRHFNNDESIDMQKSSNIIVKDSKLQLAAGQQEGLAVLKSINGNKATEITVSAVQDASEIYDFNRNRVRVLDYQYGGNIESSHHVVKDPQGNTWIFTFDTGSTSSTKMGCVFYTIYDKNGKVINEYTNRSISATFGTYSNVTRLCRPCITEASDGNYYITFTCSTGTLQIHIVKTTPTGELLEHTSKSVTLEKSFDVSGYYGTNAIEHNGELYVVSHNYNPNYIDPLYVYISKFNAKTLQYIDHKYICLNSSGLNYPGNPILYKHSDGNIYLYMQYMNRDDGFDTIAVRKRINSNLTLGDSYQVKYDRRRYCVSLYYDKTTLENGFTYGITTKSIDGNAILLLKIDLYSLDYEVLKTFHPQYDVSGGYVLKAHQTHTMTRSSVDENKFYLAYYTTEENYAMFSFDIRDLSIINEDIPLGEGRYNGAIVEFNGVPVFYHKDSILDLNIYKTTPNISKANIEYSMSFNGKDEWQNIALGEKVSLPTPADSIDILISLQTSNPAHKPSVSELTLEQWASEDLKGDLKTVTIEQLPKTKIIDDNDVILIQHNNKTMTITVKDLKEQLKQME